MNRSSSSPVSPCRRRCGASLSLAFLVITVAIVGLSAWGFDRLSHTHSITSGESPGRVAAGTHPVHVHVQLRARPQCVGDRLAGASRQRSSQAFCRRWSTRPIRRSDVLIGKWLGLAVLLASYATWSSRLEMAVVDWVSGFVPPNPVLVAVYLFAEGAVLLTLVLLISTRLSTIATGVVGVALFGAAWLAGVVGSLGRRSTSAPCVPSVRSRGTCSRPTDCGTARSTTSSPRPTSSSAWDLEAWAGIPSTLSRPPPGRTCCGPVWFLLVLTAGLPASSGASYEDTELGLAVDPSRQDAALKDPRKASGTATRLWERAPWCNRPRQVMSISRCHVPAA